MSERTLVCDECHSRIHAVPVMRIPFHYFRLGFVIFWLVCLLILLSSHMNDSDVHISQYTCIRAANFSCHRETHCVCCRELLHVIEFSETWLSSFYIKRTRQLWTNAHRWSYDKLNELFSTTQYFLFLFAGRWKSCANHNTAKQIALRSSYIFDSAYVCVVVSAISIKYRSFFYSIFLVRFIISHLFWPCSLAIQVLCVDFVLDQKSTLFYTPFAFRIEFKFVMA